MFATLLIANRGEIACRVIRTARRLGLATVAVYSDADADAPHVAMADQAVHLGPAPARDSYLCSERIIEAARRTGAQAIHPGYGFLSENAGFARACADAGIVFVGPTASAIEAMGSKRAAKTIMENAGVPVVPGYHGDDDSDARLGEEAARIGYPVLIKASAGGGGKGMRVVGHPEQLPAALAGARREAESAFGDGRLLLEKYLAEPRHIEVQVFADRHGNVVHLFERDCSLQRRHQKVIEEAPAPGVSEARRSAMGETAVAAAKAIDYLGAGTVEFIADPDGSFFFMEMNTRLQVEHPVTEMITGQDLVEWQLRVAAGEALPCRQEDLTIDGWAMEARIYAEDPAHDFLPGAGRLTWLRFPKTDKQVRIDTGTASGSEVTVHYDPMLAKLIVHDRDREACRMRLLRALEATEIVGPANNLRFLRAVAGHAAFQAGGVDTGFIDRHRRELVIPPPAVDERILSLASLYMLLERRAARRARARASGDPHSPWQDGSPWRMNAAAREVLYFTAGEQQFEVGVTHTADGYRLQIGTERVLAKGRLAEQLLTAVIDGHRQTVTIIDDDGRLTLLRHGDSFALTHVDERLHEISHDETPGSLGAPMPGTVIEVKVAIGERVTREAPLIVIEAMKMEHTVRAPYDGVVAALPYKPGDMIEEGVELARLEPAS